MKLRSYLLAAAAALALVGCGGGSGGGTATVPLSGTAAVGTPLAAGATVELRDAVGTNVDLSTTVVAGGRFTFSDVSGLTPPFMLRATGTVAGRTHTLYSFSQTLPTSGVLNATPLTNAVVQAALPSGQTLEGAFEAQSLNDTAVRSAELDRAMSQLIAALRYVYVALEVNQGANPFTTDFAADHTGLDKLLDLYQFDFEGGVLRVAEKGNLQGAITVSVAAGAEAPKPLTAPAAATANLKLLPSFVADLNAWLGDANRTPADFDALVHADFIDYGENRDQAFTFFTTQLLRTGTSVRIASYSVDGCKALPGTNQIVCDLSFGLEYTNTTTAAVRQDNAEIPVIFVQGAAQPWQLYGNQMRLGWTPPAAPPTNAVDNITQSGNLAFRFFDNSGNTQTWQASSGATGPTSGELAFAPAAAVGNQSLRVVYSDLDVPTDRWRTDFFRGTTPSNGFTDGMGNALVWCDGTGFAATRVLLSHNVQLSNMATMLVDLSDSAAGAEARTFDAIDCGHAYLRQNGHRETLTVNRDGSATSFGGPSGTLELRADEMSDLLGIGLTDTFGTFIAQIYRLDFQDGLSPIYYILLHGNESGQQSLTLFVQR